MARGFCYWLRRSPSWLTLLFPHSTVGRRYFLAAIGCTLEWERKMRDGRWDWKRVTLKIERTIRLTKTVIRILLLLSISYSYLFEWDEQKQRSAQSNYKLRPIQPNTLRTKGRQMSEFCGGCDGTPRPNVFGVFGTQKRCSSKIEEE